MLERRLDHTNDSGSNPRAPVVYESQVDSAIVRTPAGKLMDRDSRVVLYDPKKPGMDDLAETEVLSRVLEAMNRRETETTLGVIPFALRVINNEIDVDEILAQSDDPLAMMGKMAQRFIEDSADAQQTAEQSTSLVRSQDAFQKALAEVGRDTSVGRLKWQMLPPERQAVVVDYTKKAVALAAVMATGQMPQEIIERGIQNLPRVAEAYADARVAVEHVPARVEAAKMVEEGQADAIVKRQKIETAEIKSLQRVRSADRWAELGEQRISRVGDVIGRNVKGLAYNASDAVLDPDRGIIARGAKLIGKVPPSAAFGGSLGAASGLVVGIEISKVTIAASSIAPEPVIAGGVAAGVIVGSVAGKSISERLFSKFRNRP